MNCPHCKEKVTQVVRMEAYIVDVDYEFDPKYDGYFEETLYACPNCHRFLGEEFVTELYDSLYEDEEEEDEE